MIHRYREVVVSRTPSLKPYAGFQLGVEDRG